MWGEALRKSVLACLGRFQRLSETRLELVDCVVLELVGLVDRRAMKKRRRPLCMRQEARHLAAQKLVAQPRRYRTEYSKEKYILKGKKLGSLNA